MAARGRSPLAVCIGVVMLLSGAAACKNEDPSPPRGVEGEPGSTDLAEAYAPIVWLAKDEEYFPEDTETFIANSRLDLKYGCWISTVALNPEDEERYVRGQWTVDEAAVPLSSDRLGMNTNDPYTDVRDTAADGCDRPIVTVTARANERVPSELPEATFGLSLTNPQAVYGQTNITNEPVPVWWQYLDDPDGTGGAYVYWFFYAGNNFTNNGVPINAHEGDWERVAVRINETGLAESVTFHAHNAPGCQQSIGDVEMDGTHPVIYSASGSHASYPKVGVYPAGAMVYDFTNRGTRWETGKGLVEVTSAPWWGYYGTWGNPTKSEHLPSTASVAGFFGKGTAGPTGPTPDNAKVNSKSGEFDGKECEFNPVADYDPENSATSTSSPPSSTSPQPSTSSSAATGSSDPGATSGPGGGTSAEYGVLWFEGPISGNPDPSDINGETATSATIWTYPDGAGGGSIDLTTRGPSFAICSGGGPMTQTYANGYVTIQATIDWTLFEPCPQTITLVYPGTGPSTTSGTAQYTDSSGGTGTLTFK